MSGRSLDGADGDQPRAVVGVASDLVREDATVAERAAWRMS
jgi:hypothetical protein